MSVIDDKKRILQLMLAAAYADGMRDCAFSVRNNGHLFEVDKIRRRSEERAKEAMVAHKASVDIIINH